MPGRGFSVLGLLQELLYIYIMLFDVICIYTYIYVFIMLFYANYARYSLVQRFFIDGCGDLPSFGSFDIGSGFGGFEHKSCGN